MYRSTFVASILSTAVLLTACGADDGIQTSPAAVDRPATSVERSEPSAPAPTEPPADGTDVDAADDESSDESTKTEPTNDQSSSDDESDGSSPSSGTEGLPGWPIESVPVHGARFWAAYLAVGVPGDPALQKVLEDVRQSWPGAGSGELGCDDGAAAALGRNPTDHAVAVYFLTEEQITEFRRRWEAPFVGAVHVTTFCAD